MFSDKLKSLMGAKKVKPAEIAAAVNVARQTVYSWLKADFEPENETIKRVAQYFGVTVDYLLSETEDDEMVIINTGNLAAHNSRISVGETLSQQEHELIRLYQQRCLRHTIAVRARMTATRALEILTS